MAKNVRTSTLKKYISDSNIRLSVSDREFLADLAKVRIISEDDANSHHYKSSQSKSSRRLGVLAKAGVLEERVVYQPGKGKFKAYTFSNDRVAALFGGKTSLIGSKRNALHEVVTSRLYFAKGRPKSFVLECDFTDEQKKLFKLGAGIRKNSDFCLPDAIFHDGTEMVVVEADSGQYTQSQIRSKQIAWSGLKQVWGQPAKACARVHGAEVIRFK